MELALRALLTGSAAITAIAPSTRVSWGVLAQGSPLPALILNVISNTDGLTQQGPDGLWQGRVQVDCYGAKYAEALSLANAVIALLHGYRAGAFRGIFLDTRRDH